MDTIDRSCDVTEKSGDADETLTLKHAVPLLRRAASLPGKGPLATVAMLIALSIRLNRVEHILLIPRTLLEFSLSRAMVYRSLVQLENLGLVRVRRHRGQGPLVSFVIPGVAES